jgi:hypothetical protein
LDDVVATVEQLAWFAAVFRPPIADGLTVSSVSFDKLEPAELAAWPSQQNGPAFGLRLDTLNLENLRSHSGADESSTCWQELFRGGVLAYGFPIAQRDEGSGVEIPFELMTFFAQVRISMDYDAGTILLGHSSCLFPSKMLRKGVQWHFVKTSDRGVVKDVLRSCPEWVREKELSTLASLRTFLGYYPCARVLLGTERLLQRNPIAGSNLPNSSSRIELAREGTTTAGFSTKGIFNGTIGGKWTVPKGLRVNLSGNREYYDRLEKASERPILLYDCFSKSAWLVSELSLVLHLVLTYLKQPRIQQRRRIRTECEPEAWPKLPFAEACANGGESAYSTISKNHDLYLYTNEHGEKRLFWNIVDGFLNDLGSLRSAVNLKKATSGWQIFPSRLQGWDFNDLATKEESVHQRELPPKSKSATWWKLSETKNMLVIFGSGFGEVITPDLTKTKVYPGWECLPGRAELLAASMPCVLQLAKQSNVTTQPSYCYLMPELAWHKPTNRDESCNKYCNSSCICIQELRLVSTARTLFSNSRPNPPGKLSSYEAVIFGNPRYYHQSLPNPFPLRRSNSFESLLFGRAWSRSSR